MKITSIETIPVRIPINRERAIRGGGGIHLVSPFLLIKLHTDEGLVGLGEVSCTPGWSGEDQVTAAHIIRTYLEPVLVGTDPMEVERVSLRMRKAVAGNPFTRAGVEMACWERRRDFRCTGCWGVGFATKWRRNSRCLDWIRRRRRISPGGRWSRAFGS
jgi:muconate cycloisomerase